MLYPPILFYFNFLKEDDVINKEQVIDSWGSQQIWIHVRSFWYLIVMEVIFAHEINNPKPQTDQESQGYYYLILIH